MKRIRDLKVDQDLYSYFTCWDIMPALAHLGIGLMVKYWKREINVWILLIASETLDLLTFIFHKALWPTHSLIMAIIWSVLFGGISALVLKIWNRKKVSQFPVFSISLTVGLVIFSHWILDFIGWPMLAIDPTSTGTPFWFSDIPNFGLGVYSTMCGALTMDIGVFLIGLFFYLKMVAAKRAEKTQNLDNPTEIIKST